MKNISTGYHTILKSDTKIFGFGANDYGQLGIDTNFKNVLSPTELNILPDEKVITIATGSSHTLLLTKSGKLFSFGLNDYGQLGIGNKDKKTHPVYVEFFKDIKIQDIFCGHFHSFVTTSNNNIYGFGNNILGQLGYKGSDCSQDLVPLKFDKKIREIISGGYHNLLITDDDELYSFGSNIYGQLGVGDRLSRFTPTKVTFFEDNKIIPNQISAGKNFSFVLSKCGKLFGFGYNYYGQFGIGSRFDIILPKQIEFFDQLKIKKVIPGQDHTLVVCEDSIYSFGYNEYGQLGIGNRNIHALPVEIKSLRGNRIKFESKNSFAKAIFKISSFIDIKFQF